jgi:hypothetical protein
MELGKYKRFTLEFVLIVAGVLAALAVDDWRQSRSDVATERYVLEGILRDLESDIADLDFVITAANARIAGAVNILEETGVAAEKEFSMVSWDIEADREIVAANIVDAAHQEFPQSSIATFRAFRMIIAAGSMHVFNISTGTFTGSSASGDLNKVRDLELRSAISNYYYQASVSSDTVDDRVEGHWIHLRNVLAGRGLYSTTTISDDELLNLLKDDVAVTSEIANAREFAVFQIINSSGVLEDANELAASVRVALGTE